MLSLFGSFSIICVVKGFNCKISKLRCSVVFEAVAVKTATLGYKSNHFSSSKLPYHSLNGTSDSASEVPLMKRNEIKLLLNVKLLTQIH